MSCGQFMFAATGVTRGATIELKKPNLSHCSSSNLAFMHAGALAGASWHRNGRAQNRGVIYGKSAPILRSYFCVNSLQFLDFSAYHDIVAALPK